MFCLTIIHHQYSFHFSFILISRSLWSTIKRRMIICAHQHILRTVIAKLLFPKGWKVLFNAAVISTFYLSSAHGLFHRSSLPHDWLLHRCWKWVDRVSCYSVWWVLLSSATICAWRPTGAGSSFWCLTHCAHLVYHVHGHFLHLNIVRANRVK